MEDIINSHKILAGSLKKREYLQNVAYEQTTCPIFSNEAVSRSKLNISKKKCNFYLLIYLFMDKLRMLPAAQTRRGMMGFSDNKLEEMRKQVVTGKSQADLLPRFLVEVQE